MLTRALFIDVDLSFQRVPGRNQVQGRKSKNNKISRRFTSLVTWVELAVAIRMHGVLSLEIFITHILYDVRGRPYACVKVLSPRFLPFVFGASNSSLSLSLSVLAGHPFGNLI